MKHSFPFSEYPVSACLHRGPLHDRGPCFYTNTPPPKCDLSYLNSLKPPQSPQEGRYPVRNYSRVQQRIFVGFLPFPLLRDSIPSLFFPVSFFLIGESEHNDWRTTPFLQAFLPPSPLALLRSVLVFFPTNRPAVYRFSPTRVSRRWPPYETSVFCERVSLFERLVGSLPSAGHGDPLLR